MKLKNLPYHFKKCDELFKEIQPIICQENDQLKIGFHYILNRNLMIEINNEKLCNYTGSYCKKENKISIYIKTCKHVKSIVRSTLYHEWFHYYDLKILNNSPQENTTKIEENSSEYEKYVNNEWEFNAFAYQLYKYKNYKNNLNLWRRYQVLNNYNKKRMDRLMLLM